MTSKIVHAADLHLDSPLRGLSRYDHAPVERLRGATRRALSQLVELCLREQAGLLLIAGDLYDGDWRDYSTGLFFAAEMSRLRQADIQVVWIRGNHDAQSRITRHMQLPENVHELSSRGPETLRFESLQVAVHGQGFAQASVTEDLAQGYPEPVAGAFNVGLLHTALGGREGHAPYAPTDARTLSHRGYQYWALGHVHAREVVSETPWIVFPGNLQGRHARETGEKGASVIELSGTEVQSVRHVPLDVVRWARCEVDVGGAESAFDAVDRCREALEAAAQDADGRPVAARLVLQGAGRAHDALHGDADRWQAQLRATATDISGGDVWLEKVRFDTRPEVDAALLRERDDAIGQLARTLFAMREDPSALGDLLEEVQELERKFPGELVGREEARLSSDESLRDLLDDVAALLLPRLTEEHTP